MPRISVPKDQLEGIQPVENDTYTVRLDGFEPKTAKKGGSVNLNPILKIINHPKHNDLRLFNNLNSKAGWIHKDFVHAFGLPMEIQGDEALIPGEFQGPEATPEKWVYVGPLLGRTAQLVVVQTPNSNTGNPRNEIKQFLCQVPGCKEKHSTDLTSK